jgi:hypothetical protein
MKLIFILVIIVIIAAVILGINEPKGNSYMLLVINGHTDCSGEWNDWHEWFYDTKLKKCVCQHFDVNELKSGIILKEIKEKLPVTICYSEYK